MWRGEIAMHPGEPGAAAAPTGDEAPSGSTVAGRLGSGRIRVLLLAESCTPERISVPLIGWHVYRALKDVVDVHLVTHRRNEAALRRAGVPEGQVTLIDAQPVTRRLDRLSERLRATGRGWTIATALSALSYYHFEHRAWRRFRSALHAGRFDVVHRVTPVSPTCQSWMASRCPVPFVLGPINGGLPWPRQFRTAQHAEREWLSSVRDLYRLLPGYRSSLRASRAILVGSKTTRAQLPAWCQWNAIHLPENAVDPCLFVPVGRSGRRGETVALFLGRLVPFKGPDLFLEAAIPWIRRRALRCVFVGDGPQRPQLEALVRREGCEGSVEFRGWLPHAEILPYLHEADMLVLPSIREFGGGVVLEAMATGLPPIVVDYGGPGELVTARSGIKVPIGSRADIVRGVRESIGRLIADPGSRAELGRCAAERVASLFTWEAKARQIVETYEWVLGRQPERPDFGFDGPD